MPDLTIYEQVATATGAKVIATVLHDNGDGTYSRQGVTVERLAKGTRTRGRVAPGSSAPGTLLLAANANRISALLTNFGTVRVYLGNDNTVTAATAGTYVEPGGVLADGDSSDAWYGIAASGTGDIGVVEVA
jgi:hypothetical protein